MRLSNLCRLAALGILFGLMAPSLPAQQQQDTDDVAAAARKSREQQKSDTKPKKVITNDDIPAASTSAPAAESNAEKPAAEKESAAANEKDEENDPKSEVYWRKRFQKVRDKIAQSEKELDIMQRELDKNQVQYYNDPQKALTQQYSRSDINDKTAQIDAKKKEIESLKQQLSDMEDDLRKAGGNPGWAR